MRNYARLVLVLLVGMSLSGCGKTRDTEGKALKVGEQYTMTKQGLERSAFPKDKAGNKLEAGKQYLMTPQGLEPVPYLKDRFGNRVEVGNEYMMTDEGLKLVQSRNIRGTVLDSAGKPVAGAVVSVPKTGHQVETGPSGAFTLPFMEGYVDLSISTPNIPDWCATKKAESAFLNRESHPTGWDVGTIKLACAAAGNKGDKTMWATADGAYIDNGDGTVTDVKHDLVWEAETKEHSVSWNRASEYVKDLKSGGSDEWRLPTVDELSSLHEAGIACGWQGPSLIRGAISLWSSEQVGPNSAVAYNVCTGSARKSAALDEGASVNPGVLAVHDLKKK